MSSEEHFMKAILESPEDDHLRLVYADWLEERGDPRGEFIRVQYALEEVNGDEAQKHQLLFRQQQLLAEHGDRWAKPIAELTSDWTFRRGFVEEVSLDAKSIVKGGDAVFQAAPIRRLKIRAADSHFIPELIECPFLERIAGLDLGGTGIGDLSLQLMVRAPKLRHLRSLILHGNFITLEGARTLASRWEHLEELDLSYNDIDDLGLQALCAAPGFKALRSLDVSSCGITDSGIRTLSGSRLLGQLHSFKVNDNSLGNSAMRMLASSPLSVRLHSLQLASTGIDSLGVQALAAAARLKGLRRLSLAYNTLSDGAANALVLSPHLAGLEALNLVGTGIGTAGRERLTQHFRDRVTFGTKTSQSI
jgi:uncharacterized protein (TIGR02996 family)